MKLIDLTMLLSVETPVYPGDPKPELSEAANLEHDGYQDTILRMDTHNGTHIDAPIHMVVDGKSLDAFAADRFIGRGVLVDGRDGVGIQELKAADIQAGDIVLLWTGFSDNMGSDYYERVPSISPEAVSYLVQQRPSLVGVDAGSIDAEPFSVHKTLLGHDILLAENLIQLDLLAGQTFEVYALPLRLDADGAPARVVARMAG